MSLTETLNNLSLTPSSGSKSSKKGFCIECCYRTVSRNDPFNKYCSNCSRKLKEKQASEYIRAINKLIKQQQQQQRELEARHRKIVIEKYREIKKRQEELQKQQEQNKQEEAELKELLSLVE